MLLIESIHVSPIRNFNHLPKDSFVCTNTRTGTRVLMVIVQRHSHNHRIIIDRATIYGIMIHPYGTIDSAESPIVNNYIAITFNIFPINALLTDVFLCIAGRMRATHCGG